MPWWKGTPSQVRIKSFEGLGDWDWDNIIRTMDLDDYSCYTDAL